MDDSKIFDSLVKNAIDFLKQSVNDIKKKPKYSVINFCSSVELFFKAKLFVEDWTQIFSNPSKADRNALINGKFHSIGSDKLIGRIEDITEESFSKNEKDIFEKVRDRRNK